MADRGRPPDDGSGGATHGRTGAARAVLGSETARIVHDSPVPVLVVPSGADHQ